MWVYVGAHFPRMMFYWMIHNNDFQTGEHAGDLAKWHNMWLELDFV